MCCNASRSSHGNLRLGDRWRINWSVQVSNVGCLAVFCWLITIQRLLDSFSLIARCLHRNQSFIRIIFQNDRIHQQRYCFTKTVCSLLLRFRSATKHVSCPTEPNKQSSTKTVRKQNSNNLSNSLQCRSCFVSRVRILNERELTEWENWIEWFSPFIDRRQS